VVANERPVQRRIPPDQADAPGKNRTCARGLGNRCRPSRASGMVATSGAAQESNLPSLGLPDLTDFEDRLDHRVPPLRAQASGLKG
jgi:hypothetical protein